MPRIPLVLSAFLVLALGEMSLAETKARDHLKAASTKTNGNRSDLPIGEEVKIMLERLVKSDDVKLRGQLAGRIRRVLRRASRSPNEATKAAAQRLIDLAERLAGNEAITTSPAHAADTLAGRYSRCFYECNRTYNNVGYSKEYCDRLKYDSESGLSEFQCGRRVGHRHDLCILQCNLAYGASCDTHLLPRPEAILAEVSKEIDALTPPQ